MSCFHDCSQADAEMRLRRLERNTGSKCRCVLLNRSSQNETLGSPEPSDARAPRVEPTEGETASEASRHEIDCQEPKKRASKKSHNFWLRIELDESRKRASGRRSQRPRDIRLVFGGREKPLCEISVLKAERVPVDCASVCATARPKPRVVSNACVCIRLEIEVQEEKRQASRYGCCLVL